MLNCINQYLDFLRGYILIIKGRAESSKLVRIIRSFCRQLFQKKAYRVVLKSLGQVSKTTPHFTGFRPSFTFRYKCFKKGQNGVYTI